MGDLRKKSKCPWNFQCLEVVPEPNFSSVRTCMSMIVLLTYASATACFSVNGRLRKVRNFSRCLVLSAIWIKATVDGFLSLVMDDPRKYE